MGLSSDRLAQNQPVQNLPVYESADQSKLYAWVQFARAYNLMIRKIAVMLGGAGMTVPQFDALATLRFSEGVTQQELAERLLVTKGNVCQVLDRLEKSGWVQRRADPKDARTNRLHLTAAGKKKIDGILPQHNKLVIQAMAGMSTADITAFRAFLDKMELGIDEK